MVNIDDRSFFDLLYQQWTKTTRAADTYWMPVKDDDFPGFNIYAVDKDQEKFIVAESLLEADADFVTAVHGCFGDLVKRMHDALDEADRADLNHDEREQEIFKLALENEELRQEWDSTAQTLMHANDTLGLYRMEIQDKAAEIAELRQEIETARSKAADTLWKIERPM